jgi:hypothetical protein
MIKILFTIVLITSVVTSGWATVVDLTVNNNGTINGATFEYYKFNPSGTGVFDPFVRIQQNGTEQGYNTTVANAGLLPFQEKFGIWTHDLPFSSLQALGGSYQFALDIGEPVGGPGPNQSLLSLDGLKIFSTSLPGQHGSSVDGAGNASSIIGTLLYDMDAGEDSFVLLDANRDGNPGNGWSDMLLSVPASAFSPVGPSDYIILWSRFGLQEGSAESFGTFEEWGTTYASTPIPEPVTLLLLGSGLIGLAGYGRKKFLKK